MKQEGYSKFKGFTASRGFTVSFRSIWAKDKALSQITLSLIISLKGNGSAGKALEVNSETKMVERTDACKLTSDFHTVPWQVCV